MKLSKRLEAIASFIPSNGGIIDVGCNHAHICIYFALKNNNRKIIGTDCNCLSLVEAKKEIKKRNLNDKITLFVTDGLDGIKIDEGDTVVISGLGTRTIKNILTKNILNKINHIVIQSNNYLYELRKYMSGNNFIIKNELVVEDANKIYVVIDFYKASKMIGYSEHDLKYGPFAKENSVYLRNQLTILNKQLLEIKGFDFNKRDLIIKEINYIKKQLKKND